MDYGKIFSKYDNGKPFMENPAANWRNIPEIKTREDSIDYQLYVELRIYDNASHEEAMAGVEKNRSRREELYKRNRR